MTFPTSPPIPIERRVRGAPRAARPKPAGASVQLAGQHFVAATVYLIAGSIGLVWIAPTLAAGLYLSPHVAGVTHLFTLGWLTTTIFGALCQLLPGALGASIRWPRVGHASFWSFAPGAGLFACGVASGSTVLHHGGLALIATGITLALVNIVSSLNRAPNRDITWSAIALAAAFLVSTFGLGAVLLHNLHTGFLAAARLRVLATHLHVALVGWALIIMAGVSHKLLPMFLVAHDVDKRWTKRAVISLAAGIPVLALGINAGHGAVSWLGVALLELGVGCFVWQAFTFFRGRLRRHVDVGMRFAGAALVFLVVASLLGPAVLARGATSPRLATAYVLLGLLGGIVLFVIGFFYKIVPMLAWTARFSGRTDRTSVPSVTELYSARVALLQLGAMTVGLSVLAVAILAGSPRGASAGSALLLAGVLLFASQIIRIAFGSGSAARARAAAGPIGPH